VTTHRWAGGFIPAELGVIVHGPRILGRADGIAAGLRCIFAHTGGLHLVVALHATGVQAEAANRQSIDRHTPDDTGRPRRAFPRRGPSSPSWVSTTAPAGRYR
jgi:hypothetical protein